MGDPVEERKEAKPIKLFTINAFVYDDGVISGTLIEYRTLGRLKNQKCIVPDGDDFISCVRSIVPSAVYAIEPLVKQINDDLEHEDTQECEKIGKVVVDVYNDGFVDTDFGEIVKGPRGAPKTWRLQPNDFFNAIEVQVGQLTSPFQTLLDNSGFKKVALPSYTDNVGEPELEETKVYQA
jgi:hypothetical protein